MIDSVMQSMTENEECHKHVPLTVDDIALLKTLGEVEAFLLQWSANHLEVLCHAMSYIKTNFLYPKSEYITLEAYVEARHEALDLPFGGSSAHMYALGASVFEDLRPTCTTLPHTLGQVRALTLLEPESRVLVWKAACGLKKRGVITRQTLISLTQQTGAARRRGGRYTSTRYRSYGSRSKMSLDKPAATVITPATGELNLGTASSALPARNRTGPTAAGTFGLFTSQETDRWGTPDSLIKPSRKVLGGRIDLDPYSEDCFKKRVGAKEIYTKKQNANRKNWKGKVFLNAPGGKVEGESAMGLAFEKAKLEYKSGRVTACICLLKAAIGYQWFIGVYEWPVCFLYTRPCFHLPSGETLQSSPHGYVVVYLGKEILKFKEEFSSLGRVLMPVE